MFSSLAPISALVLGVHNGASNFSLSTNPGGIAIPCTVPTLLYSFHADPVMYPRTIDSMGNTLRRRTCILRLQKIGARSDIFRDNGRSRVKKWVQREGTRWERTESQCELNNVRIAPFLGIPWHIFSHLDLGLNHDERLIYSLQDLLQIELVSRYEKETFDVWEQTTS